METYPTPEEGAASGKGPAGVEGDVDGIEGGKKCNENDYDGRAVV